MPDTAQGTPKFLPGFIVCKPLSDAPLSYSDGRVQRLFSKNRDLSFDEKYELPEEIAMHLDVAGMKIDLDHDQTKTCGEMIDKVYNKETHNLWVKGRLYDTELGRQTKKNIENGTCGSVSLTTHEVARFSEDGSVDKHEVQCAGLAIVPTGMGARDKSFIVTEEEMRRLAGPENDVSGLIAPRFDTSADAMEISEADVTVSDVGVNASKDSQMNLPVCKRFKVFRFRTHAGVDMATATINAGLEQPKASEPPAQAKATTPPPAAGVAATEKKSNPPPKDAMVIDENVVVPPPAQPAPTPTPAPEQKMVQQQQQEQNSGGSNDMNTDAIGILESIEKSNLSKQNKGVVAEFIAKTIKMTDDFAAEREEIAKTAARAMMEQLAEFEEKKKKERAERRAAKKQATVAAAQDNTAPTKRTPDWIGEPMDGTSPVVSLLESKQPRAEEKSSVSLLKEYLMKRQEESKSILANRQQQQPTSNAMASDWKQPPKKKANIPIEASARARAPPTPTPPTRDGKPKNTVRFVKIKSSKIAADITGESYYEVHEDFISYLKAMMMAPDTDMKCRFTKDSVNPEGRRKDVIPHYIGF